MKRFAHSERKAGRRYTGLFSRLFALIIVLCILVWGISWVSSNVFFKETLISIIWSMEESYLDVQKDRVNSLLDRYCYSVYELAVNSELLQYAKELNKNLSSFEARQKIYFKLEEAAAASEIISVTFNPPDNNFICYSHIATPHRPRFWHSNFEEDGNNKALAELCARAEKEGKIVFGTQPGMMTHLPSRFFHIACPVYDLMTRISYGTVVFSFDLESLRRIANPTCKQQKISSALIVAPDGTVLAHEDEMWIGQPFIDEQSAAERGILPKDVLVLNSEPNSYGFYVYGIIDSGLLSRRVAYITHIQTIAVCTVISCIFFVIALILHSMSCSTRKLLNGLEKLSTGDLATVIPVEDTHEIGEITRAVNHLTEQLQILKENEQQQADQMLRALNQQHLAEMRVLEQQINAHFLYNTLNSINYTAIENDDEMVSKQIQELSVILRYALEKREESVSAAQVMEWLNAYLYLQKLRYGNGFDYSCIMDEDVKDWPMRKLLIQPFVENAVLHGLADQAFDGYLHVSFKRFNEEKIRITITDNGHGMSGARCSEINEYFSGKKEDLPSSSGVGLTNAYQRMKVYYNGQAKVFFRSAPDVQTVVTILLPRYQASSERDLR